MRSAHICALIVTCNAATRRHGKGSSDEMSMTQQHLTRPAVQQRAAEESAWKQPAQATQ